MKLPLGLAVTHNEPLYRWAPAFSVFYSACVLGTHLLSPTVPGSGGVDGDSGPHFGCSCIFTPFHRLKGYGSLKTGPRKFPYYFSRDRGSEAIFMQPCFTSTFQGSTQQFLNAGFRHTKQTKPQAPSAISGFQCYKVDYPYLFYDYLFFHIYFFR